MRERERNRKKGGKMDDDTQLDGGYYKGRDKRGNKDVSRNEETSLKIVRDWVLSVTNINWDREIGMRINMDKGIEII